MNIYIDIILRGISHLSWLVFKKKITWRHIIKVEIVGNPRRVGPVAIAEGLMEYFTCVSAIGILTTATFAIS